VIALAWRCNKKNSSMNSGLITAVAAISGSLVGALGSAVSTSIESARLLVDALQHNVGDLQKLRSVYALLSRIRRNSSSRASRGTAEEVIKTILHAYEQPNLTPAQIQIRAVNGEDPLRQFNDTCRAELDSLQRQL
jgi:hypothetical protein